MMNGGIDQQIQQKVDAYRGNPQALQQRYAQNQQLIDLLALQKLKSEKDAAARDMQMKMQQQPQTIKDQLEGEMLQRTKDDMVKQTGDLLKQRQARSQQNIRQVSQAGLPQLPAQNLAKMAGGGIVGFSAGDTVVNPDTYVSENFGGSEARARARFLELEEKGRGSVRKLSPAEAREFEILRGKFEQSPIRDALESGVSALAEGAQQLGTTLTTPRTTLSQMGTDDEDPYADQPEIDTRPPVPTEDETDYLDPQVPAQSATPAEPAPEQGGIAAVPGITATKVDAPTAQANRNLQAYKPDMSGDTAGAGLEDLLRGMTQADPTKAAEEEYERSLGKIGYSDEERALRQRRIDELDAIRARRMDPEARKREEMSAFLRGAANRSGIGSVFAGASAGAAGARKAQQLAETGLLGDVMSAETDLMKELQGQREKSYGFGQEAMKQGREDIRTGATGLGNLSVQARREAQAYADQLQKTDIANLEADDRQRKMELDAAMSNADREMEAQIKTTEGVLAQERNRIQAEANQIRSQTDAQRVLSQVQKNIQDTVEAYRESYAERIDNLRMMPPSGMSEDQVEGLIANLRQQEAQVIQASVENMRQLEAALTARAGGVDMSQFGPIQ